jgi:hypothetical protein
VFYFGEHPGESEAFFHLTAALSARPISEKYYSSITLGLALQACYLLQTDEKLKILPWVIEGISKAKDLFLKATDESGQYPLSRFLAYYLIGRDSVANNILREKFDEVSSLLLQESQSQEDKDIRKFWLLIGLMESGSVDAIQEEIKKFRPADSRLLLAFHLGCFLLENHRVAGRDEKKVAADVCKHLAERVGHLREQLLKEWKSELLEIRQGTIRAIELPKTEAEEIRLLSDHSSS